MKNMLVLIGLMAIGCGDAEAKVTNSIKNKKLIATTVEVVKPTLEDHDDWTYVEINLDDMTFMDAFAVQYRAKGEGSTFWWKGNEYTTDLANGIDEFVLRHTVYDESRLSWVTNSDDIDDHCRSNKLDDCGVCDGPGKTTWYRDKDSDGLGTYMEWITSCTYPNEMEIQRFHDNLNEKTEVIK